MKVETHTNYHAYLLRLWRDDAAAIWHASAQNPHTGQIYHFATVEQLLQFLQGQLAESSEDQVEGKN